MLLTLNDVLSCEVAAQLRTMLLKGASKTIADAGAIVLKAIWAHPLLLLGLQPRSLSQPIFRRFDEGMEASPEVDEAIVGGSDGIRADVGITVFLSDPSTYEGGELVVDTGYGPESYKGQAGGCVVRPASACYSVARVTRGTRWTSELWVQSLVRDPGKREILYNIGYSLHLLELFGGARSEDVDRLRKCQRNLLRIWSEL